MAFLRLTRIFIRSLDFWEVDRQYLPLLFIKEWARSFTVLLIIIITSKWQQQQQQWTIRIVNFNFYLVFLQKEWYYIFTFSVFLFTKKQIISNFWQSLFAQKAECKWNSSLWLKLNFFVHEKVVMLLNQHFWKRIAADKNVFPVLLHLHYKLSECGR